MSTLWAVQRRLIYILGAFAVFSLIGISGWWYFFYEQPSCFDGKQNQNEAGIDCGGACKLICPFQAADPVVLWSRSLPVTDGVYHAVAYIENPNTQAGAREVEYTFELYGSDGLPIAKREGTTYLIPNGITPVFESNIQTGKRIPTRTLFTFKVVSPWEKTVRNVNPIMITDKTLSDTDGKPRLSVRLANPTIDTFENVEAVAVIFNTKNNAIAASRTVLKRLPERSSLDVVYTWPRPFKKELEACAVPADVVLLLDVSGSMNDDQADPPQPITDALNAAGEFIGRLSEGDRVGIVTFATKASLERDLTGNISAAREIVAKLNIRSEEEHGSTNIGSGIATAHSRLGVTENPKERKKAIIMLTDGRANVPVNPGGELYAAQEANKAKGDKIEIYAIGLGNAVNAEFLRSIASDTSHYYAAASSDELAGIYRQISASICARGPAIVDVKPISRDAYFSD